MELTTLQNGRYKIETVLGQGGFGITYRAVQTSLGRTVAIKEFFMKDYCERAADSTHVTMGTQSTREMVMRYRDKFEKEARTLARLEHPHIVRVIDVFQENNTSYYVMEYAEGTSLKQQVDEKGPLPEARAVGYIRQVAGALRYLHGQRICHLDIKPANILTKANGEAVLADFGLAKQYDEAGGETSTTPVGRSKGFAPPEQYLTDGITSFSPETDMYALGATLYFLLTGKTPPESMRLNEQMLDLSMLSPRMSRAVQGAMRLRRTDRVTLDVFEKLIGDEDGKEQEDETEIVAEVVKVKESPVVQAGPTHRSASGKKKPKRRRAGLARLCLVRCLVVGVILCNLLLLIPAFTEMSYSADTKREIAVCVMCIVSLPIYIYSWVALSKSDNRGYIWMSLASFMLLFVSMVYVGYNPLQNMPYFMMGVNVGVCLILLPLRRYFSLYRLKMCAPGSSYKKKVFLQQRTKLRAIGTAIISIALFLYIVFSFVIFR